MYQSGLPVRRSSNRESSVPHSLRVMTRSVLSSLRGTFSVSERIHSASASSMPCFANVSFIIADSLESFVSVTKSFSGESGSLSISTTFSKASMAHSIIFSSGSRVVRRCSRYPGALSGNTSGDWVRASSRKTSYETPATTGRSSSLITKRMKKSRTSYPVTRYLPISHPTTAKTRMDTVSTRKMNVVPQRSCMREQPLIFSTVSGSMFS